MLFYFSLDFIFIRFTPRILIYVSDHFKINIFSLFPFFFLCFLILLCALWIKWFFNAPNIYFSFVFFVAIFVCSFAKVFFLLFKIILWFHCLRDNNNNFSYCFLLAFCKNILFFYSSGQFNNFNYLDINNDNNFNCYSFDNDDNVVMKFQ